jgi:hypothetical protein
MHDLEYLTTHPLTAAIHQHHRKLEARAETLPEVSPERKKLEKRISQLEEYCLPKPDAQDLRRSRKLVNKFGQVVGEAHSIRRRFRQNRPGRPAEYSLQVRAALEDKLANPRLTWSQLAKKYSDPARGFRFQFTDVRQLQRAVRRLKTLLRREEIQLPSPGDYPRHN